MDRINQVAEVNRLRKEGLPPEAACKQVGISYSTYGYWNAKREKKATEKEQKPKGKEPKVKVSDLPEVIPHHEETGFFIVGSAKLIADIMGRMK